MARARQQPKKALAPSAAERRVLAALAAGQAAEFDPARPRRSRTLRGDFLRELLTEVREDWPSAYPRIVIRGAVIEGLLDLCHMRRQRRLDVPVAGLEATGCEFTVEPSFCDARIESLRLRDCDLPGLSGDRLSVVSDLSLDASRIARSVSLTQVCAGAAVTGRRLRIAGSLDLESLRASQVDLREATIRGQLNMNVCQVEDDIYLNGATIGAGKSDALVVAGARIGGGLFLRQSNGSGRRFTARGKVNIVGASIRRGVEVVGARLARGRQSYALDLARLETEGCVFVRGTDGGARLDCDGAIDLSGARIGGYARIRNANLTPTPEQDPKAGPEWEASAAGVCLDLTGTRVDNFLEMLDLRSPDGGRPKGRYKFLGARAGVLAGHPVNAWPTAPNLDLTGFEYDLIRLHPAEKGAPRRLGWLRRQYSRPPRLQQFSPQPFEQLASVLRKMGYETEADEVVIEGRRVRTRCKADPPLSRALSTIMYVTSRHGYSPGRAVAWTAAYWLLGAALLTLALGTGFAWMVPAWGPSKENVDYFIGVPGIWSWTFGTNRLGCEEVVIPLYALELIIPGLHLGQADACHLVSDGLRGGLIEGVRAIYQILGAAMTAIMVTTLTGILRRD